jgi:UDP-3-O-[3-hydroxymyristoyl] glucosamine N-acyltransferase
VAHRLAELAELVGGQVEGDAERSVEAVRPLETAGPADLSFLNHARYRDQALASRAGALMVSAGLASADLRQGDRPLLVVADPAHALARLLDLFHPAEPPETGINPTAVLGPGCQVDPTAHVGPYAVIGEGSRLGPRAAVHALAVLGKNCSVGEGAVLYPHAVLYDGTEVGDGCIVHAGVVLGADGFGYATQGGVHHKVPQVGRTVLER